MSVETVYSRFRQASLQHGAAPFLCVLEETAGAYDIASGEVSYQEMLERVARWKAQLGALGYCGRHRVGLLLQNRPAFLEIWLALNALGASVVPINPDLRASELDYIAAHSDMSAAFVLPDRKDELASVANRLGRPFPVMTPDDAIEPPLGGEKVEGANGPLAECALLYTSGTTGQPKGCVLTNQYFLHSGDWYRDVGGLVALQPGRERMITPLPVFHMNAMAVSVMAMMTVGGCLILLDRFHPRTWWDSVRSSRATCLHYLGVMPSMLMSAKPSDDDRSHAVRFGFGAGVDKPLHAVFEERFGFPLIEAWAMTETGSGGVICASQDPRKPGTSCFGRPSPDVEIRIVDDTEVDVGLDVPGELLVRRAGVDPAYGFFSEYLKDPAATAEAWKGGWFHTGDIVSRDADGDLHFVDRKKNVIRRSGENIAAVEVENVLNRHPQVRQAAVAALPDAVRGDEVGALIVLKAGSGTEDLAEQIVTWCLDQMAYYKAPGWVAFVGQLPLTATEKIQRAGLKLLVARTQAAGLFYDTRSLKKRTT